MICHFAHIHCVPVYDGCDNKVERHGPFLLRIRRSVINGAFLVEVWLSDAVRKTSRPRPATVLSLAAHRARHDAGLPEYDPFDCAPAFSKMQETADLIDIGDQGAKP
jgi:hypothetical protein